MGEVIERSGVKNIFTIRDWNRVAGCGLRVAGWMVLKDWELGSVMAERREGKLGLFGSEHRGLGVRPDAQRAGA